MDLQKCDKCNDYYYGDQCNCVLPVSDDLSKLDIRE